MLSEKHPMARDAAERHNPATASNLSMALEELAALRDVKALRLFVTRDAAPQAKPADIKHFLDKWLKELTREISCELKRSVKSLNTAERALLLYVSRHK